MYSFCLSLATEVYTVHPKDIATEMAANPIGEQPEWIKTVSPRFNSPL